MLDLYFLDLNPVATDSNNSTSFDIAFVNTALSPQLHDLYYGEHAWLVDVEEACESGRIKRFNVPNQQEIDNYPDVAGLKDIVELLSDPAVRGHGRFYESSVGEYRAKLQKKLGLNIYNLSCACRSALEGSKYHLTQVNLPNRLAPCFRITFKAKVNNNGTLTPEQKKEVLKLLDNKGFNEKSVYEFKKKYNTIYANQGFFGRNPFSTMALKLKFGSVYSMDEIKQHAKENPGSRTAGLLK